MVDSKTRSYRLDAFRVYAIFLVVIGHVQFRGHLLNDTPFSYFFSYFICITGRWVIPYFFILAGYLLEGKILREPGQKIPIVKTYTKKLATIFLFWCAVYLLENPSEVFEYAKAHPISLLLQGTKIHLWYLVSLIMTVWVFAWWPSNKKASSFLYLGIILFFLGLLGGSYKQTPLGFDIKISTRDGIFFSTFFFAIGVWLKQRPPSINKTQALAIALIGVTIFSLEAFLLSSTMDMRQHDFLLGSIPFGIGTFLFALQGKDHRHDYIIGRYGRYVLGIYVSHFLFIPFWQPLGRYFSSDVWPLLFPVIVFATSLLVTIALSKTPLKRFVV